MMWQIVLSLVCVAFLGAILWEKRQGKLMQSASDRKLENVKVGSINSIFYFLHKAAEPFNCLEQDNLA